MSSSHPPHTPAEQPSVPEGGGPDADAARALDQAQVRESKDRGAFTRYRIMAFITGAFLLLLCVEMFLKYGLRLGGSEADGSAAEVLGDWIAIVHGWIYVVYLVFVFDLWIRMRWTFGRLVALIAGGVVPVLSFIMERNARVWVDETIATRPHNRLREGAGPG